MRLSTVRLFLALSIIASPAVNAQVAVTVNAFALTNPNRSGDILELEGNHSVRVSGVTVSHAFWSFYLLGRLQSCGPGAAGATLGNPCEVRATGVSIERENFRFCDTHSSMSCSQYPTAMVQARTRAEFGSIVDFDADSCISVGDYCQFANSTDPGNGTGDVPGNNDPAEEDKSPIILDLDRNGFHLTGIENPVSFDIDADGLPDTIPWTSPEELDGLLALDRNDNGLIDDGSELFGTATPLIDGGTAASGFVPLAEYDQEALGGNGNGEIDPGDAIFRDLRIWIDRDHDGYSQLIELSPPEAFGIRRIELAFVENRRQDPHGNTFRYSSRAWVAGSGQSELPVATSDVFFASQ